MPAAVPAEARWPDLPVHCAGVLGFHPSSWPQFMVMSVGRIRGETTWPSRKCG